MVEKAKQVAVEYLSRAYCPYSGFPVVAVLYGSDAVVPGVNVENTSYGLTMCAERVAVFKAVSEGLRRFDGIYIYSPKGFPYPCGACRQVLVEFFPADFTVVVSNGLNDKVFTLSSLMPFPFKEKF